MHSSVRDVWVAYNTPLEGRVHSLYADVRGLMTTGMGNLVDPIDVALPLPWKTPQNNLAPKSQIVAAWNAVKNDPRSAVLGWVYAKSIPENNLHLDDGDIDTLIYSKLDANDSSFASRFADWESRPADAQLAIHSMGWAMGPYFWSKFPRFTNAFTSEDYATCASECQISPSIGTIVIRNKRNVALFFNSKQVASSPNTDRSVLLWHP
jgi:hypothetical protein